MEHHMLPSSFSSSSSQRMEECPSSEIATTTTVPSTAPPIDACSTTRMEQLQCIAITGKKGTPIYTKSHLIHGRGVQANQPSWSYGFQNSIPVPIDNLLELELCVAGVHVPTMFQPTCCVIRSQNQHEHLEPRLEILVLDTSHTHIPPDGVCMAVGMELFPVSEELCQWIGLPNVRDAVSWQQLANVLHGPSQRHVQDHQQPLPTEMEQSSSSMIQQPTQLMVEFIGVQIPKADAAELLWSGIAELTTTK